MSARDLAALARVIEAAQQMGFLSPEGLAVAIDAAGWISPDAARDMRGQIDALRDIVDEYRYCGADLRRDEYPYTCERRIGHSGPCGPTRDDADTRIGFTLTPAGEAAAGKDTRKGESTRLPVLLRKLNRPMGGGERRG